MSQQTNTKTSVHYTGKSLSALYTDALHALYALRDEMVRQGLVEGQVKPPANGSKPPQSDADATQDLPVVPLSPLAALRAVVDLENFVVLDTETTGLNDGEICQIAIIDHKGNTLLDQLVKPTRPIPFDAQRIHGIGNDQVKGAPGWAEVAPRVVEILTGKDVIVYNAVYDRKMMHKSAEYAGIEKIDWKALSPWYCAMEAYAEFYGEWNDYRQSFRWQKLSFAAQQCSVEVKNAHNALGDCLMTLGVVRYMQTH